VAKVLKPVKDEVEYGSDCDSLIQNGSSVACNSLS